MQEHVLSTNDFGMPMVFKDSDAEYMHIIRLILLEPGTFQSHPDMGVGLRSRYRYNNNPALLQDLQSRIKSQMQTYLPSIITSDVLLSIDDNKTLGIIINTSDGAYVLAYNNDLDKIEVAENASYVLNDL